MVCWRSVVSVWMQRSFCPGESEELGAVQLNGIVPPARVFFEVTVREHRALFQLHIELPTRTFYFDAEDSFDVQLGRCVSVVIVRTILPHAEAERLGVDLLLKG